MAKSNPAQQHPNSGGSKTRGNGGPNRPVPATRPGGGAGSNVGSTRRGHR